MSPTLEPPLDKPFGFTETLTLPNIPTAAIARLLGRRNAVPIRDMPAGTVVFDGGDSFTEFSSSGEKTATLVYGFRYDPEGWGRHAHEGNELYPPADLGELLA